MTEPNSQPEKPEGKRRYDPGLLKKGLRCDLDQYEMLKRCSDKKDMAEWNNWRIAHPDVEVLLQGAELDHLYLKGAFLNTGTFRDQSGTERTFTGKVSLYYAGLEMAHLEDALLERADLRNAKLWEANLQAANLRETCLQHANFKRTQLQGAEFGRAKLQAADFSRAIVDGGTLIWRCKIDRRTKFEGVVLDSARIYPATRQLLEYNVRRMNWEAWYKYTNWQENKDERHVVVQKLMWFISRFWDISDYGISTKRITWTFFKWAFLFALVYYIWGFIDYYFVGVENNPGIVTNLFVLTDEQEPVPCWLVPFRGVYFSVVTMTTLGFGDMYANPQSIWGHILLTIQVILGYVLLGALITRFAVLFTAGGPAGEFADDEKEDDGK